MCSNETHDYLLENSDWEMCPHCFKPLVDFSTLKPPIKKCCEEMNLIKTLDYCNICDKWGQSFGYDTSNDFIDFHENRYRFYKKAH